MVISTLKTQLLVSITVIANAILGEEGTYVTLTRTISDPAKEQSASDPLLAAFPDKVTDGEIADATEELVEEAQYWMAKDEGRI